MMNNEELFRVWFRANGNGWKCFHQEMAVNSATANRVATNMLLGCIQEVAILRDGSTIAEGYVITNR